LALGRWSITVEAAGFKRLVWERVTLAAGQTATIDLRLEPGEIQETVTVSGDAPVADTGKTDFGRVMNTREVHNVPLPTRNPYSLIILQANITGRAQRSGQYPQINVNGFIRRVNYLLDGNNNTRGDVAGARLTFISETYIREMQLLTPSYAAEFGNTTGMVVNMITPSGTNELHGSGMYLFTAPSFYARPFNFAARELADSESRNALMTVGGPIIKDRWHFYFGYEWLNRIDNSQGNRQSTIKQTDKELLVALGVPASTFVSGLPGIENAAHYIFRTDVGLNRTNSLTARYSHADTGLENSTGGGGFNTSERSTDLCTADNSLGVQLVSFSSRMLNEFRFQFAGLRSLAVRNELSGTGPGITITGVATFGSPQDTDSRSVTNFTQIQNNFTWTRDSHAVKFGGGYLFRNAYSRLELSTMYTFPSIDAFRDARSGITPRGYTRYEETLGDPETRLRSTFWNIFAQDDWKVSRRLKVNYGLRYDHYLVPKADPTSPFPASRKFNTDRNNLAPRLGLVYALQEGQRPLVLRAGAGIYFEPPWMNMYTRALLSPEFFSMSFCGNDGGSNCLPHPNAPAFPNRFSGSLPGAQDIATIDPEFENLYAIHTNIQLEKALTDDLSLSVGYFHSGGRHIPVYRNINPTTAIRFLDDGRPVFGPERLDPRFNIIQMVESDGVSRYDALTLQLTQRFSNGIQFAANYTLSRAVDDAAEQNVTYNDAGGNQRAMSDPTNRSLDKGYSYGDQLHTFVMSIVARPSFGLSNRAFRLILNDNQFGVITRASSGERFSVISGRIVNGNLARLDLNADGLDFPDRPVGIKRNSGKTPPQFNLDLKYSRFVNFTDRYSLEIFGVIQNLFNIKNIVAYRNVIVNTDALTGRMIGPMPDFKARNQSTLLESRQAQLGLRFIF
jgi:hypothetical protein